MTIVELAGGACLLLPEEPIELKCGLRDALLEVQDPRQGLIDDISFSGWLWDQWQLVLEPTGFGREAFVDVVMSCHRELWLWLMDDRVWVQFISGVAGRIARRMPVTGGANRQQHR